MIFFCWKKWSELSETAEGRGGLVFLLLLLSIDSGMWGRVHTGSEDPHRCTSGIILTLMGNSFLLVKCDPATDNFNLIEWRGGNLDLLHFSSVWNRKQLLHLGCREISATFYYRRALGHLLFSKKIKVVFQCPKILRSSSICLKDWGPNILL